MTAPPRCSCCGRPLSKRSDGKNWARTGGGANWSVACWRRWDRAGRPPEGPPPPMSAAARTALANGPRMAAAAKRAAEYARLRSIRYSPAQAALRLGLGERAGELYERAYQASTERREAA